jgi:hypothetical protein
MEPERRFTRCEAWGSSKWRKRVERLADLLHKTPWRALCCFAPATNTLPTEPTFFTAPLPRCVFFSS